MTKLTELTGQKDPRGPAGMMARGANVYNGGSNAAQQGGGPQFGRPSGMGMPTGAPPGLQMAGGHAPMDKSMGLQQLLQRLGLMNPIAQPGGGGAPGAQPMFQTSSPPSAPGGFGPEAIKRRFAGGA